LDLRGLVPSTIGASLAGLIARFWRFCLNIRWVAFGALNAAFWSMFATASGKPTFSTEARSSYSIVLLVVVLALGLVVAREVAKVTTRSGIPDILFAITLFMTIPAWSALCLTDRSTSQRQWFNTAWYWAVEPLPVELHEVFDWRPPRRSDLDLVESAVMTSVQLFTILLLLGSLKVIYNVWSAGHTPRSRRPDT
jgi:hypothetical protein